MHQLILLQNIENISNVYFSLTSFSLTIWNIWYRVWFCGGMVIRQSCSRVSHVYKHIFKGKTITVNRFIYILKVLLVAMVLSFHEQMTLLAMAQLKEWLTQM